MRKKYVLGCMVVVFAFILIVTCVGCGASVSGKYVNQDQSAESIVLSSNGSIDFQQNGSSLGKGTYKVENGKIIITNANGEKYTGTLSGNTITEEGVKWVKQ